MNKSGILSILFLFLFVSAQGGSEISVQKEKSSHGISIECPSILMADIPADVTVSILGTGKTLDTCILVLANGKTDTLNFSDGVAHLKYVFKSKEKSLKLESGEFEAKKDARPIPLWLSLIPALVTIAMALIFREVYSALFSGLLVGTTIIFSYVDGSVWMGLLHGSQALIDTYIVNAMADKGHLSIIIFSMLIGACVSLVSKNGGMQGLVNILLRYARSRRSGQLITWFLGVLIFFDDYANSLIVGNTMRPLTDRYKISREKLAYIVDSTAAPVASLALITTWIGIELGYIQDGLDAVGLEMSAYSVFISSLDTRFYPIFTLIFIGILIFSGRDFGPMRSAEKRALAMKDKIQDDEDADKEKPKARWYNAVIPILVIVLGTFAGLIATGWDASVWKDDSLSGFSAMSVIIGKSDSYVALLWASLAGVFVALIMTLSQRIFSLRQNMEHLIDGLKTMLTPMLILVLAWGLALVSKDLHTAEFLTNVLAGLKMPPFLLPALTFIFAALIAFATGSSWGTMAIFYPLILPASWMVCQQAGLNMEESTAIFFNVVSSILAGSVLGDHCSPISDTTILSSLATSCDHIEHVRTQMPYALLVGVVSILIGSIPSGFGVSSWILFPAGIIVMIVLVRILGRKPDPKLMQND